MHICIPSSWFCIISLKARAGGFGGGGGGCNGGGGGGGYIGGRSSRTIYCILGDIYNILYIGILGDIYLGKVTQTTLLNTKWWRWRIGRTYFFRGGRNGSQNGEGGWSYVDTKVFAAGVLLLFYKCNMYLVFLLIWSILTEHEFCIQVVIWHKHVVGRHTGPGEVGGDHGGGRDDGGVRWWSWWVGVDDGWWWFFKNLRSKSTHSCFFRSFSSLIYQQAKTTRSARFDQTFICTIVLLMQNMTILYHLYNAYMILITIMIVMNGKDYDVAVFWCWQPLPRRLWGRVRRQLLLPQWKGHY